MENNEGIESGNEGFENEMNEDGAVEGEMSDGESESDGIETEMGASETSSTEKIVEPAKDGKATTTPAYEAFLAAIQAQATALGLASKEQKGFYQFANATTGHKLYVAKQGRAVTRVDTTLPPSSLSGISLPLEKANGRIACHVEATVEAVSLALDVLANFGEKIPAPKRAAKAEGASASK